MSDSSQIEIPGSGHRALLADLYRPNAAHSLHSAVILLHGGAWRFGAHGDMAPYARLLAGHGFLAIAAEYRLLGEAAYPAQLEDVRDVIAWTRTHAQELDVDPGKISLEGFSAGAHLALIAAGTAEQHAASRVAAVVSFFAPPSLEAPAPAGMPSLASMLLGEGASEAAVRAASPIQQIRPGFPPTFLLSGTADLLVPTAATLRLFDALAAVQADVEMHLYHGHTHEFAALPSMLEPVQAEVALFLKRSVIDPARYAAENLELNMFARPGALPPMPPT